MSVRGAAFAVIPTGTLGEASLSLHREYIDSSAYERRGPSAKPNSYMSISSDTFHDIFIL